MRRRDEEARLKEEEKERKKEEREKEKKEKEEEKEWKQAEKGKPPRGKTTKRTGDTEPPVQTANDEGHSPTTGGTYSSANQHAFWPSLSPKTH